MVFLAEQHKTWLVKVTTTKVPNKKYSCPSVDRLVCNVSSGTDTSREITLEKPSTNMILSPEQLKGKPAEVYNHVKFKEKELVKKCASANAKKDNNHVKFKEMELVKKCASANGKKEKQAY